MKQPTSQFLYDYWNGVRGDRLAPTRFEIEPARIAAILSDTFILERGSGGQHPFRLAGTRICEQFGQELRGRDFSWLAGGARQAVGHTLDTIAREGGAGVFELEAVRDDGSAVAFEAVVLPLVHPASSVTRFLGALSAIDPPDWLGAHPLEPTAVVGSQIVWPDGRVPERAEYDSRQAPFSPSLAAARIVWSDRRQFRILDGGRKA